MIAFALVTSLGEDGKENGKEGELFQVMILLFLANEISSERSKSKNLPLPPNNPHHTPLPLTIEKLSTALLKKV